jgi:hypothetical protein
MARGHWSLLHGAKHHQNHPPPAPTAAAAANGETCGGGGGEDEGADLRQLPPNRAALVLTVSVDAFVDGFLIGLCAVSSKTTAYIMAAATALEMGFLGLAYGSLLRGDLAAWGHKDPKAAPRTVWVARALATWALKDLAPCGNTHARTTWQQFR